MKNTSGIQPCGDRILIQPDEAEKVSDGGIIIPAQISEQMGYAQTIGTFIAAGPDAYIHHVTKSGDKTEINGFTRPFAKPGDRVAFAKYGGLQVTGKDGIAYRILNDVDVTAILEDGVTFSDLKTRKPVHGR
jgi:chaperonin GroES